MQKKLHNYLLLVLAFWFLPFSAYTQTYPVTISTQLTQPSPIYLSNYANTASINSPIKVQLILNDLTIMNRQVRLKCYFQGAVSFVTNDFVVGAAPIYLEGGFPTQLTNAELGPYFEFQNIKGINPNQYAQPLPEGIYTISFEVYDFATNKKLSKKSSVTTVIFQNEPPFLNLPANQAGIVEQNIQNIVFSWTPRSINVSNVEYEFSLVEIWNSNTPLQNAFAYSPPLYTTTTRNTTVQYSITEPQLIPGKTYAWRVKARALLGAEEIGVFKNNGYSETYSFKYLSFCKPPLAITTTDVSQEQAKVTWSGAVDNYDYQVNYREKNADSKWYKLVTPREYILISNLKPKTTYEYTVGAACDPNEYTHSNIQEFTTLAQDEIAFTGCGIKPDPAALSNKTPLPALFPNDVVTAGDFPIVVLKSTGSNGTFSGEGYVTLPFLAKFRELIDAAAALAGSDDNGDSKANIGKYTRIRITFNNIGVNTEFKLISGEIVASYDPNWGSMIDGDKLVNDVMGDTGTVIPLDVQFEIKSVVKNADGTLTITGTNGVVVTQPKTDNDIIITDRNGKQYAVSPNAPVGNIESTGKAAPGGIPTPQNTNGMGSGGAITQISSPDVSITFAAGTGYYALDENPNQNPKLKDNTKLNNTYDVIPKKDGTNYYVHYKVVSDAPKAEDYVTAKATFSNGKTTADIVFKTENGTEIPSTWSGNVATLTLKRTLDFAKESILATVKPPVQKDSVKVTTKYDIAGTLNMWHVTGKKVNVTLVGLNGGETPSQSQAQEYLNNIYGKAGIQFEVNTIKIDIAQSWGTSIETGDSDLLNTYTNGQQTITNNFQTQLGASYKNDTYYVFFAGVPASKSGVLGFMPLKRQFGFVFSQSEDKKLHTLAHELGHGIFGLQHPFTNYNATVTTDLLMDYGTGTALSHNDWEIMHAPGLQLYQFTQGSSAGELAGGFAIAPDFTFVSNGNESTVANLNLAPKGFLGGLVSDTKRYKWQDKKYVNENDLTDIFSKTSKEAAIGSIIWLFFDNDKPINSNKFLRTVYNAELKNVLDTKQSEKLNAFIDKYATVANFKQKDEKRETYWGYIACSKCNSDGVANGNSERNLVVDKTGKITAEELQKLIAQVSTSNQVNGINAKIFITAKEDTKGIADVKKEIADLEKSDKREIYIWAKNYQSSTNFDVELAYGKGLSSTEKLDFDHFEATIKKINNQKESWLACIQLEGAYSYFNPLTAMLDGLAGLIGKAAIPEKYFNPDATDYNPLPAKLYAYSTGAILSEIGSKEKHPPSRVEFAFVCGAWNGLVGTVEAIPLGVSMLTKLQGSAIDIAINQDGTRDKLIKTLSNINKDQINQLFATLGDAINKGYEKYTSNPCMKSYASGQAVFVIASMFIGAGEANAAKTFVQTLEKLDVAGQLIGKVFKIGGKFIKPILNATSKGITLTLEKGVQLFRQIEIKLPNNLCCGIPIPNIKIKSTAAEIEQQLANAVEDVNGNKLIEVVLENGEKAPAIVGTEEGLAKVSSELAKDLASYINISKFIKELASHDIEMIIKSWDDDMLKLLEADLSSKSMADELKSLLSATDNIEIWKYLKTNPEFAFELAAESPDWAKWSKGNFFKTVTKLGRSLNFKIIAALENKSSTLFKELETQIGRSLKDYNILKEVPLETTNGFMKADVILVLRNSDDVIQDVIIIENKLSSNTALTARQKEGFGAIINGQKNMKVKYKVDGLKVEDGPLSVSTDKIFKISDHGTDDISKVGIQKITNIK